MGSMTDVLMVVNGAAYGSDATYNAVRLAGTLAKRDAVDVTVFLLGDGVTAAIGGQQTPDGYYKLDRMLTGVARAGGRVLCCGTCLDARGIGEAMLLPGARRSSLEELADATLAAEKVLVF